MIFDECNTKIGQLRFVFHEQGGELQQIILTDAYWNSFCNGKDIKRSRDLGKTVREQFQEYLNGERQQFDLDFKLNGTLFQLEVWQALQDISYGRTKSYLEIASSIGRPKAIRAVGHANAINPLPIIIPCHRVIGKDKKLTGYAGGMRMKKDLLQIEGVDI